jgi:ribosome biogenesis protein BMS1
MWETAGIPSKLQAELPFASKPKLFKAQRARTTPTYEQSRAVVIDAREKKANTLIQQLHTIRNVKDAKRKESKLKARGVYLKKQDQEAAKHANTNQENKKRRIIAEEQGRHVKQKRYSDK